MTYAAHQEEQQHLKRMLQAEIFRTARLLFFAHIMPGKRPLPQEEEIKIPKDLEILKNRISSSYGSPWRDAAYEIIEDFEDKKGSKTKEYAEVFELAQRITRKLFN